MEFITPHSHRFDFACLVLRGEARNTLFVQDEFGEPWCRSEINQVCGSGGLMDYVHTRADAPTLWKHKTYEFGAGTVYEMRHDEIHSIKFARGTQVLFFEGPEVATTSVMLEPWENSKVVPTFRTEPWMFDRT